MIVRAENYEQYRLWLASMVALTMPDVEAGSDVDPIRVLDETAETAPARAREGLGQAIGDVVEMTMNLSSDELTLIDQNLVAHGLPTLTELRLLFNKVVRRVMRRGSITSEAEYYLMRNAAEVCGDQQGRLLELVGEYESRATN